MRAPVLLMLLAVLSAAADEVVFAPKPYAVRKLDFEIAVPAGWTTQQDHTGMVARDKDGTGFLVSREPFVQDPATFTESWQGELAKGGKTTKVGKTKTTRYDAWRAAWSSDAADGRNIEVWRIHVPGVEMLYNIAFSSPKARDIAAVVKGVTTSFKCSAKKPTLRFQKKTESVTPSVQIRLPEGYEKSGGGGVTLGGGIVGGYVKRLTGYAEPHVAGQITWRGLNPRARGPIRRGGKSLAGTDAKGLLEEFWEMAREDLAKAGKARPRSARFAGIKGFSLVADVEAKDGAPKKWMGFVGRAKDATIVIMILIDAREARMHKHFLKELCSRLEVRD